MAGGAWEYVMGNYNNNPYNTTNMKTMPVSPYINFYMYSDGFSAGQPSWSTSPTQYFYNFDVCTYQTCGGQANYETTATQSVSSDDQSWGSDCSDFVFSSYPWFVRGGYSINGTYAGLFASSVSLGYGHDFVGFRVVASGF
jgi:hypothetical protein